MALDTYTECPCGSGKKLKFCCSKDLLHDLEKIWKALEGEQRVAALDLINKLIAAKGARPALLALRAETLLALNNLEEAAAANAQLLQAQPHSSVGLATQAMLDALNGQVETAMERLQESFENTEASITPATYLAVAVVAERLLMAGKPFAARGLLLLQSGWTNDLKSITQMLEQMNATPQMPLLLKNEYYFPSCPDNVRWQGEYRAITKSVQRGAWLAACESLESLNQKVPDQPCIWRGIAILRGWLGQNEASVAAWRKYASLPGVSADDAIEAEALAILLAPPTAGDTIDVTRLTYPVRDTDRLMELLLSDKRFDAMTNDLAQLAEEGQPPPKGAFFYLDKPLPKSPEDVQDLKDLPVLLGDVYVFGRQTDREARLELILDRSPEFETHRKELIAKFNELVGPLEKEEVIDQIPRLRHAMGMRYRFPPGIAQEKVRGWMKDHRRAMYMTQWPQIPQGIFDGKTPADASQDPALRNRVSGAILSLELANEELSPESGIDFNDLRRNLGLPERGEPQPDDTQLAIMSLVRLGRLNLERLSDQDLQLVYNRSAFTRYRAALYRAAAEIVKRPSMAEKVDLSRVYQTLVSVCPDSDEALQHVETARQRSASRRESPAVWHLLELRLRLLRGEAADCQRLLQILSTRHVREPGVAESLHALLVEHGVINQDGSPVARQATPEAGPVAAAAAAAPAASSIWTPDSAAPAAKPESKLWLPGNE